MKTLEFKLQPTKAQQEKLDLWMRDLKWVWNRGVLLIEEFGRFNYYHKPDKTTYKCCPITSYNHRHKATYPSCPVGWIVDDWDKSDRVYPVRISRTGKAVQQLNFFGIQPAFTHKEHNDKPWLQEIPSKFIDGCVKSLAESWQAFTHKSHPNRKPPKFKKRNDKITTLIHNNSKGTGIKGDRVNIPKLGYVKVKGFQSRWDANVQFCPLKICKYPSGYYLQITGEVATKKKVRKKHAIAGLDAGVVRFLTDDKDKAVQPPAYLKNALLQLNKLQRKAARQRSHLDNEGKKTHECKNLQKTYRRIAKVHERIKRQRRAFNHWQSTKLVNQFDAIAIEDLNLQGMTKTPKPKERADGKGHEHNGRKRKAGLNRSLLDAGIGQLFQMVEDKGKRAQTKVIRVNPKNTSITCSKCGYVDAENRIRQDLFRCKQCNFSLNADHNAAINIKMRGMKGV